MSYRKFSGREVAKVLVHQWNFEPISARGSHRKFRYENDDTGEVRTVIVPLHEELKTGTLREIADGAGAKDFDEFRDALEREL